MIGSEAEAYTILEGWRWGANGTSCPHCGSVRVHYLNPENGEGRMTRTGAMSYRRVWFCGGCRKQFSVLTGTPLQGTKVSLQLLLLILDDPNIRTIRGVVRQYGVSYQTARSVLGLVQKVAA